MSYTVTIMHPRELFAPHMPVVKHSRSQKLFNTDALSAAHVQISGGRVSVATTNRYMLVQSYGKLDCDDTARFALPCAAVALLAKTRCNAAFITVEVDGTVTLELDAKTTYAPITQDLPGLDSVARVFRADPQPLDAGDRCALSAEVLAVLSAVVKATGKHAGLDMRRSERLWVATIDDNVRAVIMSARTNGAFGASDPAWPDIERVSATPVLPEPASAVA